MVKSIMQDKNAFFLKFFFIDVDVIIVWKILC